MNEMYDRRHAESILRRVGVPDGRRAEILDSIDFPIDLNTLQAVVEPLGIEHDALIDRMGGSP